MRRTHDQGLTVHPGKAGYTLTEMLVVIAVIGLIAAVLTPNLLGQLSRARSKAAALQLKSLSSAIVLFKDDTGRYPTLTEGLQALIVEPPGAEGWTGPYIEEAASLRDPWGQPVLYSLDPSGLRYQVTSLGADARPGGRGIDRDISAPQERP